MAYGGADRWTWRAPVVVIVGVLAALCVTVAVVTAWTRTTLVDTGGYVDTLAAPLAADPDVKEAVATELARQMTDNMGTSLTASLEQWMPEGNDVARMAVAQWGAQIEQGWRDQLRPAIRAQLDQPRFNELWVQANAEAHRQLIEALTDAGTGAAVTLDLHTIAQDAVRETGVLLDEQLGLPNSVGAMIYGAMAAALPPEVGRISVDVSHVSERARQGLSLVDPILGASAVAGAALTLLAVGVAPRRRRGVALVIIGVCVVLGAVSLRFSSATEAATAGDRAAAVSVKPLSEEMRLVVDRQAELAADSFAGWMTVMAIGGLAVALVGGVWRLISGRGIDPFADDFARGDTTWTQSATATAPTSTWSSY